MSLWDMSRELEGQEGVRSHTTVVFADRGSTESNVTEVGLYSEHALSERQQKLIILSDANFPLKPFFKATASQSKTVLRYGTHSSRIIIRERLLSYLRFSAGLSNAIWLTHDLSTH